MDMGYRCFSMVIDIKANIRMEIFMVKVDINGLMVHIMKDNFIMDLDLVLEAGNPPRNRMQINFMDNILRTVKQDMAATNGEMELFMRDILKTI